MATQRGGRTTPRKRPEPQVEVNFDPNVLTVGDIMDLEEHFGVSLDQLLGMVSGKAIEKLSSKTFGALAFVIMRQIDPEFAPQDVRTVKVADIIKIVSGGPDAQVKPAKQRLAGSSGGPATTEGPTVAG